MSLKANDICFYHRIYVQTVMYIKEGSRYNKKTSMKTILRKSLQLYRNITVLLSLNFRSAILGGGKYSGNRKRNGNLLLPATNSRNAPESPTIQACRN